MDTMINLNDLFKHEILDLYSAEEQIIEALPAMIESATNAELKKALREHLAVTKEQKRRLDKVKQLFGEGEEQEEKKNLFDRLFGNEKCKGMEGLITEGNKIMKADITEEALDAAIIASAQKIEHYEISGYGTAVAFAKQLQLRDAEKLLTQTLNEEYQADDLLTKLAVNKLNPKAENFSIDSSSNRGSSKTAKKAATKPAKKAATKSKGSKTKLHSRAKNDKD